MKLSLKYVWVIKTFLLRIDEFQHSTFRADRASKIIKTNAGLGFGGAMLGVVKFPLRNNYNNMPSPSLENCCIY